MVIYLIEAKGAHGYDCNNGFVVAAHSEEEARALASRFTADEGDIWCDASLSTCERLGEADPGFNYNPCVLLRDFSAG